MGTLTIPPYRAALLTNADGSPLVRANGPDSELVMTERQWYMFWQNVASQINAGAETLATIGNMLTFGNHADRPDPGPWPDGALYVEQDRGSALYQNQGGTWQYVAGIMYGTLVPDQRPADLGPAADAGFQFRTTTSPARAFTWNGGQWIETTPIRYGTHAERLAAPIADLVSGMLWMETDRGSVIYQNQGGTWLFLTGTMWDTMSPDHRPTDLGVHDAGFDYRSTDPPPREFVWNQTAWVEVTNISGATGLTHANVVTKVGTAGQIVEGGITDQSAANSDKLHITAAGNIGVGEPAASFPLHVVRVQGTANLAGMQQFAVSTNSNPQYNIWIGYGNPGIGANLGAMQAQAGGAPVQLLLNPSGGPVGVGMLNPAFQLQLAVDSAAKPTTSTWAVVSDLRLKQNIKPVTDDAIAILNKLEWVRYEYNGQASTPKGAKGLGLVAQTLREQLPEAVRGTRTKLNDADAEETDVLAIDYHHVFVHCARAIQQLAAEVKRLAALVELVS